MQNTSEVNAENNICITFCVNCTNAKLNLDILSSSPVRPHSFVLRDLVRYIYHVMYRQCVLVSPPRWMYRLVARTLELSPFVPHMTRDMLTRVSPPSPHTILSPPPLSLTHSYTYLTRPHPESLVWKMWACLPWLWKIWLSQFSADIEISFILIAHLMNWRHQTSPSQPHTLVHQPTLCAQQMMSLLAQLKFNVSDWWGVCVCARYV